MRTLDLVAEGGVLRLELADWCRCYLVVDSKIYLGADRLDIIVSRLLRALSDDPVDTPYRLEGEPVGNVLNLSEVHHSLYTTNFAHVQKFFWQDSSASSISSMCIIGTQVLSKQQRKIWRSQLEALGREPPTNELIHQL